MVPADREDQIVEEVRAAREAYAARFEYDLTRIFADLKAKEARDPSPRASLTPVKPRVRV